MRAVSNIRRPPGPCLNDGWNRRQESAGIAPRDPALLLAAPKAPGPRAPRPQAPRVPSPPARTRARTAPAPAASASPCGSCALPRQRGCGLQQLLHPQSRSHLHEHVSRPISGVGEPVYGPRRDDDGVSSAGDDRFETLLELHGSLHHLEALLLLRMDVSAWYVALRV